MNIIKIPYCDIKFKVRIWKAAALSLSTRFPLTATCDTKLPDMEETAQLDEESVLTSNTKFTLWIYKERKKKTRNEKKRLEFLKAF